MDTKESSSASSDVSNCMANNHEQTTTGCSCSKMESITNILPNFMIENERMIENESSDLKERSLHEMGCSSSQLASIKNIVPNFMIENERMIENESDMDERSLHEMGCSCNAVAGCGVTDAQTESDLQDRFLHEMGCSCSAVAGSSCSNLESIKNIVPNFMIENKGMIENESDLKERSLHEMGYSSNQLGSIKNIVPNFMIENERMIENESDMDERSLHEMGCSCNAVTGCGVTDAQTESDLKDRFLHEMGCSCSAVAGSSCSNLKSVKNIVPNFMIENEGMIETESDLEERSLHEMGCSSSQLESIKNIVPNFMIENERMIENESDVEERSLQEMGFSAVNLDTWNNIQPPKPNLSDMIMNLIDNGLYPSVQIRIADNNFNCHMIVLQCRSKFFMNLSDTIIELPEEKVTPKSFMTIYSWMVSEKLSVEPEEIFPVFVAANYLEIDEIVEECWNRLGDREYFREEKAFLIYQEALKKGQSNLADIMLSRVCKFFLSLVASGDFLQLAAKQVCHLLCASTIGVHSEIEVLMAAVRWLTHDWERRKTYLLDIAKCIRFYLMPCWYLVTLTKVPSSPEVDKLVKHPEVVPMITDGISIIASQIHLNENEGAFHKYLCDMPLRPAQRIWICDKQCDYHYCSLRQNLAGTTFKMFNKYMRKIRSIGKDHWRTVQLAEDITFPSQLEKDIIVPS